MGRELIGSCTNTGLLVLKPPHRERARQLRAQWRKRRTGCCAAYSWRNGERKMMRRWCKPTMRTGWFRSWGTAGLFSMISWQGTGMILILLLPILRVQVGSQRCRIPNQKNTKKAVVAIVSRLSEENHNHIYTHSPLSVMPAVSVTGFLERKKKKKTPKIKITI